MPDSKTTSSTTDRPLVRLTGKAALVVRDTVAEQQTKVLVRRTADVLEESYRITVSPEQAKALREGTQVWAKAGKGDASLRLHDAVNGKPMPEAKLEKVSARSAAKPSVTKVLGPAVWEAMALATQQHYLVEISDKLEGIASDVEEVLGRLRRR